MIDNKVRTVFHIETLVIIAGVSMPHSSISLTTAFNAPPSCTVTLPPDHRLFGIGRYDRVPIQIFYKDNFNPPTSLEGLPPEFQQHEELRSHYNYRMLFEGDITTFGYRSTKIGREFVINAHGILSFLRDVKLEFLNSIDQVITARTMGVGQSQITQFYHFGLLSALFSKGLSFQGEGNLINTPYDFLDNVYKFLEQTHKMSESSGEFETLEDKEKKETVTYYNESPLADFYERYSKKISLSSRATKVPYFDKNNEWYKISPGSGDDRIVFPLLAYMQAEQKLKAVMGMYESAPPTESIYDLLMFLVMQLEYEFAFISSPILRNTEDGVKLVSSLLKPIFYDAHPPKSNVIFGSLCSGISTNEHVYAVPTRIRLSMQGAVFDALLGGGPDNHLLNIAKYSFWPRGDQEDTGTTPSYSPFANAREIPEEQYTGPYLYEAFAPDWAFMMGTKSLTEAGGAGIKNVRDHIMQMYLLLKKFEYRSLSVTSAFNPYVVPGYPGVVFDKEDTKLSFAGHVLSITHSLTKHSASTSIEMGFCRSLKEATEEETKIKSVFEPIYTEVTSQPDKMTEIYNETIGCDAVAFEDLYKKYVTDGDSTPSSAEAYNYNFRDIVDLGSYAAFMKTLVASDTNLSNDMPIFGFEATNHFTGKGNNSEDYFSDRYDKELVSLLLGIASSEYNNNIYARGDTLVFDFDPYINRETWPKPEDQSDND